ncbi:MAG: hypothetical protein BWX72_01023 [Firmicutes bacterium ADurb.Bin080]|nr:hypothetical protein [Clostridiales bacterium]OQC15295.1 MAG: hypothetical protein BWX72_01023 [Firmicutes bacterium ADurb.Bin080]
MFGYITADKPNMLIKDYAEYRAYYCGLCKSIGKINPQLMRLTVNYDIVMLSILAHNYAKIKPEAGMGRCVIHPIGKKFAILKHDQVQEKIVDINTILGYYKLKDDISDENSGKKKIAKDYIKGKYKKAAKRIPGFDSIISKIYEDFDIIQKNKGNLSELIEKSAEMLSEVGKEACPGYDDSLDVFCRNLGRWIYLIDAYDDLWKDYKSNSYNPLIMGKELTEEIVEDLTTMVRANLNDYIRKIRDSYDTMDITISEGPLSNVIYLGLQARTDQVLENRGNKCKKTLL